MPARVAPGAPVYEVARIEKVAHDPKLAKVELNWCHARLVWYEGERQYHRDETAKHKRTAEQCEKKLADLQLTFDQERLRARKATSELKLAEYKNTSIRRLADIESKKARDAEANAEAEKLRANHLERRVSKLEKALREARRDDGKLSSAIRKITTSSAVGKRLAAAVHPVLDSARRAWRGYVPADADCRALAQAGLHVCFRQCRNVW